MKIGRRDGAARAPSERRSQDDSQTERSSGRRRRRASDQSLWCTKKSTAARASSSRRMKDDKDVENVVQRSQIGAGHERRAPLQYIRRGQGQHRPPDTGLEADAASQAPDVAAKSARRARLSRASPEPAMVKQQTGGEVRVKERQTRDWTLAGAQIGVPLAPGGFLRRSTTRQRGRQRSYRLNSCMPSVASRGRVWTSREADPS